jgi:hypothetical protein
VSFLYPRTVALYRPTSSGTATGVQPVQEFRLTDATEIAAAIPCSIQFKTEGGRPLTEQAGDVRTRAEWAVFIPLGPARAKGIGAPGQILGGDILVDDAGTRYQVAQPYWNSLGWQLRAELLTEA